MQHKLLSSLSLLLWACLIAFPSVTAEAQTPNDTVYAPKVIFTGMPRTYEIAGIEVRGADNYDDFIIINYAGLKEGQRLEIPGEELTDAAKRLWRQGLFSKVQI
nr:outer membrane protein assembly factor BamA [Paramuribaculum sp.]